MEPKTYTIISDKGGGAIIVKQSVTGCIIALIFFTTIKDINDQLLSQPEIKLEFIEAESIEKAYADACEWTKENIDRECNIEEGYEFIDIVNRMIKSVKN